jgi:hypothetical protein
LQTFGGEQFKLVIVGDSKLYEGCNNRVLVG